MVTNYIIYLIYRLNKTQVYFGFYIVSSELENLEKVLKGVKLILMKFKHEIFKRVYDRTWPDVCLFC